MGLWVVGAVQLVKQLGKVLVKGDWVATGLHDPMTTCGRRRNLCSNKKV